MIKNRFITTSMVVILIGIFTLIPGCQQAKSSSFSQASGIEDEKIDRIVVQADWGESKTFTSRTDIDAILRYFEAYQYTRDDSQMSYSGGTSFTFYSGNTRKSNVFLGFYPIINDKKYRTDKEMDSSISKVTGLTPQAVKSREILRDHKSRRIFYFGILA